MIKTTLGLLVISLFLILPGKSEAQNAGAEVKASGPIQTQETEFPGVVAELTECKRSEGVLTIKVTFRNTGNETSSVNIDTDHGKYDDIYVTADSKKYFVLKDTEGAPLAPRYIQDDLKKGGKILWWAKFPAPPAEAKKINVVFPKVVPFEDVPIKD
jgi:hypothetical protein